MAILRHARARQRAEADATQESFKTRTSQHTYDVPQGYAGARANQDQNHVYEGQGSDLGMVEEPPSVPL